jgi:hypothetical protein
MSSEAQRTILTPVVSDSSHLGERLLLEELCCDLSRFEHVRRDGLAPEHVQIDREVALGRPGAFADIRVRPRGGETYFVEVKYGCPDDAILRSLARNMRNPMKSSAMLRESCLWSIGSAARIGRVWCAGRGRRYSAQA